MFTFRPVYLALTLALLLTEILIAAFLHDRFVRPYVGDFLVVMLLYCCGRTFLRVAPGSLAVGVLLVAYGIETLQYLHLLTHLGLQDSRLARVVLGSSFEWGDMLAYTLGVAVVVLIEKWRGAESG